MTLSNGPGKSGRSFFRRLGYGLDGVRSALRREVSTVVDNVRAGVERVRNSGDMVAQVSEEMRGLASFFRDAASLAVAPISTTLAVRDSNADTLTGLPNRRWLHNYVEGSLRPGVRRLNQDREQGVRDERVFIGMLDIDRFKLVNDAFGHNIGDEVLVRFAERMAQLLPLHRNNVVGRWGGEEFVAILDRVAAEGGKGDRKYTYPSHGAAAAAVLDRANRNLDIFIGLGNDGEFCVLSEAEVAEVKEAGNVVKIAALSDPNAKVLTELVRSGQAVAVSFSAGVSEFKSDSEFGNVRGDADKVLYVAKGGGRACVCFEGGEGVVKYDESHRKFHGSDPDLDDGSGRQRRTGSGRERLAVIE